MAGPLGAATPVFMSIDHPVTAPELQVTGAWHPWSLRSPHVLHL